MSAEWALDTMRSLSPLTTSTGWVMTDRSSGCGEAGGTDGLELGAASLHRDPLVAVVGALLEPAQVGLRGGLARRASAGRTGSARVLQGGGRLEVGLHRHLGDLVDAAAALGAGAGEDDPSHEIGCLEQHHLGHAAAEREPEEVDLFEAHGPDERNGVAAHRVDVGGHLPAGAPDTAVVERDHPAVRGDAVDDPGIPVVEHRHQVVQEHHRDAALGAELPVRERRPVHIDHPCRHVLPLGRHRLRSHLRSSVVIGGRS